MGLSRISDHFPKNISLSINIQVFTTKMFLILKVAHLTNLVSSFCRMISIPLLSIRILFIGLQTF